MSLRDKKIHELRGIAQSMNVKFNFGMTKEAMVQAIEAAQVALIPAPPLPEPKPVECDPNNLDHALIREVLSDFIDRGLRVDFPDDVTWRLKRGEKEDTGHISTPMHVLIDAARRCM